MCLAVPGRVVAIDPEGPGLPMGRVDFAGVNREVCLAGTPEVQVGDYVLVHAVLALNVLDEQEAQTTFEYDNLHYNYDLLFIQTVPKRQNATIMMCKCKIAYGSMLRNM